MCPAFHTATQPHGGVGAEMLLLLLLLLLRPHATCFPTHPLTHLPPTFHPPSPTFQPPTFHSLPCAMQGNRMEVWAERPLGEEMLHYAASDVRYLHALYAQLTTQLPAEIQQRVSVCTRATASLQLTRYIARALRAEHGRIRL
jgi:hypothetical protein